MIQQLTIIKIFVCHPEYNIQLQFYNFLNSNWNGLTIQAMHNEKWHASMFQNQAKAGPWK